MTNDVTTSSYDDTLHDDEFFSDVAETVYDAPQSLGTLDAQVSSQTLTSDVTLYSSNKKWDVHVTKMTTSLSNS